MLKNLRYLNKIQIISNVALLPLFILSIITQKEKIISLFWIFLTLALLGNTLFEGKWGKEGKTWFKKLDKSYSKNLTRRTSNTLDICFLIYAILFIIFSLVKDYISMSNLFVISIIFYIITLVYEFIAIKVVVRTANEVENIIKTKNDRMTRKNR